ncbi:MAG: hypothetical protein K5923_05640 [Clostridia bacterium]|nr:hypothetical protein [Clostridia bacterium]
MRRGLIIFLAVMALMFSVILCACEKPEYIDPNVDPNGNPIEDLTELVSEAGVVITGDTFPDGATIKFKEVTDQEILDEINTKIENQTDRGFYYNSDKAILTVAKVVELSIYNGDEKWDANKSLTYRIPYELLGINNQSDSYDYELFKLNSNSFAKYIDTYSYNYNLGWSFTTAQPKYLVLVKKEAPPCKHKNMDEFDGREPTFFSEGAIRYRRCRDCDKYFDENGNEITYEETIIPKLSKNIDLYVNGNKKYEFTLKKDENREIKWEIEGANLKAGDVITLVSKEDNSLLYTFDVDIESNLSKSGKVRTDVDAAKIDLAYTVRYSINYETNSFIGKETLYLSISGGEYYYLKQSGNQWGTYIEDPDENGIIIYDNVETSDYSYMYIYKHTVDGDIQQNVTFKTDLASSISSGYYIGAKGLFKFVFDINKSEVTVFANKVYQSGFYRGAYMQVLGESAKINRSSATSKYRNGIKTIQPKWTNIFVSNEYTKYQLYDDDYHLVENATIAEDSQSYIKYNDTEKCFEFLQTGIYDFMIWEDTREVSVQRLGDPVHDFEICRTNPRVSTQSTKYSLQTTNYDGILKYEPESLIYAGENLVVLDKNDRMHRYYMLSDDADSKYVSLSHETLTFKISGVYVIYFDINTLKINVELIRELNSSEILIPSTGILYAIYDYYGNADKSFELTINQNNSDELCMLNVVISDEEPTYNVHVSDYHQVDFMTSDNIRVADITLVGEIPEGVDLWKDCEFYNGIWIRKAGTYNIYFNKTTHEVRVEKIATN